MARGPRLDAPGTLHHVMVRGIERRKIFDDDRDREDFLRRLGKVIEEGEARCFAWALIPNHAHLLLRTGSERIDRIMRRLLTGYAVTFNLRHGRAGHLFQNRYRSIICEEEPYLLELVRYIHLNPVRAGLVKGMEELDGYRWCGHSVIMGNVKRSWHAGEEVLCYFAARRGRARARYREFVSEGFSQGRRADLTKGGSGKIEKNETRGERELTDARVLGSGGFVKAILAGEERRLRERAILKRRGVNARRVWDCIAKAY